MEAAKSAFEMVMVMVMVMERWRDGEMERWSEPEGGED